MNYLSHAVRYILSNWCSSYWNNNTNKQMQFPCDQMLFKIIFVCKTYCGGQNVNGDGFRIICSTFLLTFSFYCYTTGIRSPRLSDADIRNSQSRWSSLICGSWLSSTDNHYFTTLLHYIIQLIPHALAPRVNGTQLNHHCACKFSCS